MKDSPWLRVFYNELTKSATNVIFFNRPRRDGGACFSSNRNEFLGEKNYIIQGNQIAMNKGEYIDKQLELGHRYRTGNGVKKDIRIAMMHYKNADEAGDLIGHWYYKKLERERDERQLKYILMPVIFLVIFLGAWMDYPLTATIVCLLHCTGFVLKR